MSVILLYIDLLLYPVITVLSPTHYAGTKLILFLVSEIQLLLSRNLQPSDGT